MTYTPAIAGDLERQQTPEESAADLERLRQEELDRRHLPPDFSSASAADQERLMRQSMADRLRRFEAWMAMQVQSGWNLMVNGRTNLGIDDKYARELERWRGEQLPTMDGLGRIVEGRKDSHLTTGLTLGLFADTCTTLPPRMARFLLAADRSPVEFRPRGTRKENPIKTKLVEELTDAQIEQARWRAEMKLVLESLPRHGTGIARQSWSSRLCWRQSESGDFEQVNAGDGMAVQSWNLLNVVVSNPDRPFAWDQDAVIWYSRRTLNELLPEERAIQTRWETREIDGQAQLVPAFDVTGRFFGLERFRRQIERDGQGGPMAEGSEQSAENTQGSVERIDRVAVQEVADNYEWQGYFPIGYALRQGLLDAQMLEYYGIAFRVKGRPVEGVEAMARLADQLFWYITVVWDGKNSGEAIEFRPCPYAHRRNEMLAAVFVRDGERFYGRSAYDLASSVEDSADRALNSIDKIMDNNARPPKGVMAGVFEDDEDAAKALNEPDSTFIVKNGSLPDPTNAVAYFIKPWSDGLLTHLQNLQAFYASRTMTSPIAKGEQAQTESNTLGEARQQLAGNDERLLFIVEDIGDTTLIAPSIRLMLEDLDFFTSDADLEAMASRIAGTLGMDSESIWPTAEAGGGRRMNLAQEFEIKSAAAAAIEKEVAIQFLLKAGEVGFTTDPAMDQEKVHRKLFSLMGFDPDAFFSDPTGGLSPRREFEALLKAGDAPQVSPTEDALSVHLPAHMQQLQQLEAIRSEYETQGLPTEAVEGWMNVLRKHILDTQELGQQQLQAMVQQAQQQLQQQQQVRQPSGGKAGAGGGGGAGEALKPGSGPQIANGIAQGARQQPPAPEVRS